MSFRIGRVAFQAKKACNTSRLCLLLVFVCLLDLILYVTVNNFLNVGTGLRGLKQYQARINGSCSRRKCSVANEARTRNPSLAAIEIYMLL